MIHLQHRELRVVTARDSFVAENPTNFENAIEAAHEHALQPEFSCDAQEEVDIERVVMGDKRPRRRPARRVFQHRRFYFDELPVFEKTPDVRNDPGTQQQPRARLLIYDHIEIALAIDLLRIAEPMPFFR